MKLFKQILNYIFCQNDTSNVSEDKQEPPVGDLTKDEYDGVGEPIKSFIECFKSNPTRFTRVYVGYRCAELKDTYTNTVYTLEERLFEGFKLCSWECEENPRIIHIICFSEKELSYLWDNLIYNREAMKRLRRLNVYKESLMQRQKLMRVYCNEV